MQDQESDHSSNATVSTPTETELKPERTTIDDGLRERGFTSPLPPAFEKLKEPEGLHYLKLYLEKDPAASTKLAESSAEITSMLKKHGASQSLGDELANWLYSRADQDAQKVHQSLTEKAQADKISLERENAQKVLQESEEYRAKHYESERRENLQKTSEWSKAKKLFDAKVARGQKEFSLEQLNDLLYNEKFVKLAAELSDLRIGTDKNYIPRPQDPEEESKMYKKTLRNALNYLNLGG